MHLTASKSIARNTSRYVTPLLYFLKRESSSVSQSSLYRSQSTICADYKAGCGIKNISDDVQDRVQFCFCGAGAISVQRRFKGSRSNEANAEPLKENTEIDERIYTHHLVEPPNPDSNLRRITFAMPRKLHSHDKKLIQERDDTFEWNNEFWKSHNKKFFQEKKDFSKRMENSGSLSEKDMSDEMSKFYKDFLDRHYQMHMDYNRQWYKRNFGMLLTALRASLKRITQGR